MNVARIVFKDVLYVAHGTLVTREYKINIIFKRQTGLSSRAHTQNWID